MQLVAFKGDGSLFRAQSTSELETEQDKERIQSDAVETLTFQVMTEGEFEQYLDSLPKPPEIPSELEQLKQSAAQTSADLQAFMDYYFSNGGV